MQDKELEKVLQEKADNVKMRDFSEVWDEIKDEISTQKKEKKSIFKNKFFLIFAPALLVICIALTPLFFLKPTPTPPPDKIYFADKLLVNMVTTDELLDGLSLANVTHVNLSKYILTDTYLYYTENTEVKGAKLTFYNESNMTFFAKMKLYDKSVDLKINTSLYENNIQVNSADVFYKFKSNSSGFYDYELYATYNNVKYVIEYSGVTDNLMEFLTEFFA